MNGVGTGPVIIGPALEKRLRSRARPETVAAPLLASDALKCARKIGFRLFDTPPDFKYTREEKARFDDGNYVDSTAAETLARECNAQVQVPFNWLPEVPLKGKADGGHRLNGERAIVEVKSQNEKGWSRAVGLWNNVDPGPKPEWVVQGGLGACSPSVDAKWLHIVLVDNDRFVVDEWVIDVDKPISLPDEAPVVDEETGEKLEGLTVRERVRDELQRQLAILVECEAGMLPARVIPGHGLVDQPPSRDDQHAAPWNCKYCSHQPTCAGLPSGAVPDFAEMPK